MAERLQRRGLYSRLLIIEDFTSKLRVGFGLNCATSEQDVKHRQNLFTSIVTPSLVECWQMVDTTFQIVTPQPLVQRAEV